MRLLAPSQACYAGKQEMGHSRSLAGQSDTVYDSLARRQTGGFLERFPKKVIYDQDAGADILFSVV